MNFKHKLSFQITWVIFLFFLIFGIIFLFIFSDSVSIKDLFSKLFEQKIIFWKSVEYFFAYLFLKVFFMLFWIYFIVYFFVRKYLEHIQLYNKKLKDYNHYLAHELKTPISIMSSNLDILKYEYSQDKITKSKEELKNMTNIINGLLDYSQSIQISNKTDINLENFLKKHIYFLPDEQKKSIFIHNEQFNMSICTDEILFSRVVKNLIENAMKYSLDKQLDIIIQSDKMIFKNNIFVTLEPDELEKIVQKNYSRSYSQNQWNGLGFAMISEIISVLWFQMKISSSNNTFYVEILFQKTSD